MRLPILCCIVLHHLLPSGAGSLKTMRVIMKSAMIVGNRAIHTKKHCASKPTKYRSRGACDVSASTTGSTT